MKRKISLLLCLVMLFCMLSGCSSSGGDLMKGVTPRDEKKEAIAIGGENAVLPTDFAVRLFQACLSDEENTLVSPVSLLFALAMTANGAEEETLAQMEEVMGESVSHWNGYLKAYTDALPEAERYKIHIANSIWFSEDGRLSVEKDFLQRNADYYGADIFEIPFDAAAPESINGWVEENTAGMIRNILDEIPPEAVMYLVNAMAFDAEWMASYLEEDIRDGIFTSEQGEERTVEMMHSTEDCYLEDEYATGFMKYYMDKRYAFVALLPNESVSVQEYVDSLSGEHLAAMLSAPEETLVIATMPKFESESEMELSVVLAAMGMPDAFSADDADFSGIGTARDGNLYLSRVLHKTGITVDERGTKAGAATMVEMLAAEASQPLDIKTVTLDRPFVYMIVDRNAKLPIFIGTMMDLG